MIPGFQDPEDVHDDILATGFSHSDLKDAPHRSGMVDGFFSIVRDMLLGL